MDKKLHVFAAHIEKFFTLKSMTFNVHQLLHVCKSVKNWGPIWAHSAFAFENGNHELLQFIKCGKGVILQILRLINMGHSISILQNKVFSEESKIAKKYCSECLRHEVKNSFKLTDNTYFGKGKGIDKSIREKYKLSSSCKSFIKVVRKGCLYMSCLKVNPSSDNSKAQLRDGRFVEIKGRYGPIANTFFTDILYL